jgi:hypothetical protein
VLRRWSPALAGLLVLAVALVVPMASRSSSLPKAARPVAAATPAAPAIVPVSAGRPVPGRATLVAGPFTDRLRLHTLRLARSPKVAAAGQFAQVADNSAIIVMEVQADFYDAAGALLASKRTVLRQPDVIGGTGVQRYGGHVPFTVAAPPAVAARVSSALVSVPVLVNE